METNGNRFNMNNLLKKLLFVIAFVIGTQTFAQNQTNVTVLMQLSDTYNTKWENAQQRVVEYALQNNLEIKHDTEDGRTFEMVDVRDGMPVYYVTDNLGAAKTTRVSELWVGGSSGLDI